MEISVLICRLVVLPSPIIRADSGDEKRRYLAYITTDKVSVYRVIIYVRIIKYLATPSSRLDSTFFLTTATHTTPCA